ncbi:hypothetical protein [Aquimarina algiphila]|uniref:hypothetical protein n=1 Tax=Aquimarina algiphila TaxID=2047982 RepID=UPI0023308E04|nr:hypothetical protein [Aquimarina algiphila]
MKDEQLHFLQIIGYLRELFTEKQFEEALELMIELGEQTKADDTLIQKLHYFLTHTLKKQKEGPL